MTEKQLATKKKRVKPKSDVETSVLIKCRRRCCLCFGLNNLDKETEGQIAHIDQDPSNSNEENLMFLCLRHHTLFDSKTSQHINLKPGEIVHWRDALYTHLEEQAKAAREQGAIDH